MFNCHCELLRVCNTIFWGEWFFHSHFHVHTHTHTNASIGIELYVLTIFYVRIILCGNAMNLVKRQRFCSEFDMFVQNFHVNQSVDASEKSF